MIEFEYNKYVWSIWAVVSALKKCMMVIEWVGLSDSKRTVEWFLIYSSYVKYMPKDIVYHDEFDDDDNNMYNPIHHCVSINFGFSGQIFINCVIAN